MSYPFLYLKPKRERSIIHRHPWIFSGAVDKLDQNAKEGDIVEIFSADKKLLGYGFLSPNSQITCRMFEWTQTPIDVDTEDYWHGKIARALEIRKKLVISESTNCYRLLHAEGDFFPGIIADVYDNVVVVQILVKATEQRKQLIVNAIKRCGFEHIYVKSKTSSHVIEDVQLASGWLAGEQSVPAVAIENNVKFYVDYIEGQKTGFFIDQRDNRLLLQQLSKGKKVLNTFSYTGGFSAYAVAGGATEVVSVDISKEAVEMADKNVRLNYPKANHVSVAADCFDYLKEMPENEFDLIVLDPPAFAKSARAVDNASRGYKQINMRAFQKIKPGGILFTFSCSQNISKELFQKIVFGAAADARRNVRIIHQLHQPCDHPINIYHPEGEYLKGLVLWVE